MLDAAIGEGHSATQDIAACICRGQPAMAPLWNICAAALADFAHPGRYAMRRAEFARAPRALERAASVALRELLGGPSHVQLLSLSSSGSVLRALVSLAEQQSVEVICGESRPGREGVGFADELRASDIRAKVVDDPMLTSYLSSASAVIVGADAIEEMTWTNKAGTYGLAAAAWFSGVPVYVVASRDKAAAPALAPHLAANLPFEKTPVQLATLFLTDGGPVPPDGLPNLVGRYADDISHLLNHLA